MNFKNEKEFQHFLKILAEETVRDAYSKLLEAPEDNEEDEEALAGDDEGSEGAEEDSDEDFENSLFGDEDAAQGDDEGEEDLEMDDEPEKESPEKVSIRPTPITLELGKVSSDGLIATLNMIRAGRSFKEADIASELREYFDEHLNDAEKLALATFLSGIQDIVSGMSAQEAPDPGDENVKISTTDKEAQENDPDSVQYRAAQVPAPTSRMADLEDTSAPIKVGPRNESRDREMRNYVKQLLERNRD